MMYNNELETERQQQILPVVLFIIAAIETIAISFFLFLSRSTVDNPIAIILTVVFISWFLCIAYFFHRRMKSENMKEQGSEEL